MNRKHLKEDGTAKAWLTRSAAHRRCVGDPHMRAYFCFTCRGWHVGHTNGTREEATEWTRTLERIAKELGVAS